jgi:hypothetical protein
MVVIIILKARQIIAKISKGINHDSTCVLRGLLRNVTDAVDNVEFILEKMRK